MQAEALSAPSLTSLRSGTECVTTGQAHVNLMHPVKAVADAVLQQITCLAGPTQLPRGIACIFIPPSICSVESRRSLLRTPCGPSICGHTATVRLGPRMPSCKSCCAGDCRTEAARLNWKLASSAARNDVHVGQGAADAVAWPVAEGYEALGGAWHCSARWRLR